LIVPKTSDGRVMFAIPWHGRTVIGTTDTPVDRVPLEPRPLAEEVDFLLETSGEYLAGPPQRSDVLSVFAGIRPLVRTKEARKTSRLARDHTIEVSDSKLVTIAGGKWTTYREMAEDCVDRAADVGGLAPRPCRTTQLHLHGADGRADAAAAQAHYGSDAARIEELLLSQPGLREKLHDRLPYTAAEVIWAARHELARTVEDVLSRRTRALLLDARAAVEAAPRVAAILAEELSRDDNWQLRQVAEFRALAAGYLLG
jgi:glycerol-3-phosphate dehydrogenase